MDQLEVEIPQNFFRILYNLKERKWKLILEETLKLLTGKRIRLVRFR